MNRMAPLQTSTATRLAFIDQKANRTEKVNPTSRLGPVATRSMTLTNERSRSGSRSQPTALYNEAATLCVTDARPSAYKVNISSKNSHHLNNSTHSQQQSERRRNQPICLRTEWCSNNLRTNKKCTPYNLPCAPTLHVPGGLFRQDVSTRRQYLRNEELISKCLNRNC
ncbi:hypothetical protein FHG87_001972 [Trinorchestia longiramus]|nr:hypothetical protein FHG87_001972 [Trinorchestia longiramus]